MALLVQKTRSRRVTLNEELNNYVDSVFSLIFLRILLQVTLL